MLSNNSTPNNHIPQHRRLSDTPMFNNGFPQKGVPRVDSKSISQRRRPQSFFSVMLIVLTILFAGSTVYFAKQNYDLKNNPAKFSDGEKAELISRVGKLMTLPVGEDPTIATVTDLEVLKGQPFFDRAQIGDKVLIYSIAKKAILFNPSSNKVVEVSPIGDSSENDAM